MTPWRRSPALVLPIGKLAIEQFLEFDKLTEVIGKQFTVSKHGQTFDLIPLPHPSGASPWHRMEPGKTLLEKALRLITRHPAWPRGGESVAGKERAIAKLKRIPRQKRAADLRRD